MSTVLSQKINSISIKKVMPDEHREVSKEVFEKTIIKKILDNLDYEDEKTPLFHDTISARYFLTMRNGNGGFRARVLRRFIDLGDGWQYITNEAFLNELENALRDTESIPIVKPRGEGQFEFEDL